MPLLAEVCLVGLAVGDPWLPVWLEVLLVGVVGIAPVLWMQWKRPFCIFSLTPLALRPDALSDDRRRMLHLFKGTEVQALAGSAAIALFLLLWQLFRFAPVATEAAATLPQNRALGLLIAAIAFLLCNLFVQVPLSVIRALLSSDEAIAQFAPYTPAEVAQSFTIPGFRVKQILPDLVAAASPVPPAIKRGSQSNPYGNRPQTPPDAPLATDEALDESPWDEAEPSVSKPVTLERSVPEPATPEPPLETSTVPPEPFSVDSPEAFQPEEFQPADVDAETSSDLQPPVEPSTDSAGVASETVVSETVVSETVVSETVVLEASADGSADGSADHSDRDEDAAATAATLDGAIAQAPEPATGEATMLNLGLDRSLDSGDDVGGSIAAGLDASDSPDSPDAPLEFIDASATESTYDSPVPQTQEIVDASALLANQPAGKTTEGAIAPEQNSLEEPSDPISADTLDLNVEALVAEALEAVDAELLRELPDPLTDVSLTDDAASEFESPERPPAENP
ncbi:hypothetical protein O77CONTIG1_02361 [Leptolyngbya sp. O-77]|nr:hypothetical protein O77CONTIG1_02361 [Leptolyngbya sp. O-77]